MTERPWDTLKRLRTKKGWTQAQLARGIVSQSMVCHIEAGRIFPSNRALCLLAERLGIDCVRWLEEWRIYKSRQMVRDLLWEAFIGQNSEKTYDLIGKYVGIITDFELWVYSAWLAAHNASILSAELSIQTAWEHGVRDRAMTYHEQTRILVVEAKTHEEICRKTKRLYAASWWSVVAESRLSNINHERKTN